MLRIGARRTRGELQGAHFDTACAPERGLSPGLLRDFPVLIDAGNEVIDGKTARDFTLYVEEGGAAEPVS
ncbi:MAG: hypothetical protein PHC88_09700 [Terrimicrobiaceae bacterium]|nr:hypothetical protein [Terrimicrobiaceae bacterium]